MRVLAVSSYPVLAGSELSLAVFLDHRPPDVEPSALVLGDGPLRGHLAAHGVPTWAAPERAGRPRPAGVPRFTRGLSALLGRLRPDVVWATGLKAAALCAPACRLRGIPIVWHKVDFSLDDVVTRPLGAAVNGVVSVSNAAAAALGPLRRRRLLGVVGPPIRLDPALRVDPGAGPPTIGTLATLAPIKGQDQIIRAAAELVDEFPELRVVLAGGAGSDDSEYPRELEDLAVRCGVRDRIELPGHVDDVVRVLDRLTVFVNATYRDDRGFGFEGLSGAMLEASWAGLPVVATRGGGTPEGVLDGVTGTLVDPGDPAALAAAIRPYLRDRERARAAGEEGRRFARDRFAPDRAGARLFALLREAASS